MCTKYGVYVFIPEPWGDVDPKRSSDTLGHDPTTSTLGVTEEGFRMRQRHAMRVRMTPDLFMVMDLGCPAYSRLTPCVSGDVCRLSLMIQSILTYSTHSM